MTAREVLAELEALGTEQNRKIYRRHSSGERIYGVSFANLGKLQKRIKRDHALAMDLWASGYFEARVLAVLFYSTKPIKPSLVATLLFQETQSITGILHRIESRGWVKRLPDPNDRRAVGLELTDKGREVTAEIVRISDDLYQDLFGVSLTATDKKTMETILRKVRLQGFKLPETDFKLRRAQQYPIWKD